MKFRDFARMAIFVVAATMSVPASASEWWYVNSGPGRVVFVDAQSIERKKDIVTFWVMVVIRPGEPEVMTKTHMRADCETRKLGFLSAFRFDEQGRQIGSSPSRPGPMQAVPPDSLGDAQLHFGCGDVGYRVTNDLFPVAIDEVKFAEALIASGNKAETAHGLHEAMVRKPHPATVSDSAKSKPEPTAIAPGVAEQATAGPAFAGTDSEASDQDGEVRTLEKSCDDGDADDCRRLGTVFADGTGVSRDAARAALLFAKACSGGKADACTLLGIAYHKGDGVPTNEARAAALFAEACEKGGPGSCGNIGLAYAPGNGVTKDDKRAVGYFSAACDAGNASGCSSLGAAYTLGIAVKHDARRARKFFERACDGDDETGCYNLGVVYDQGLGVRKDPARAVPLYTRACAADEGAACGNLGLLTQSGSGIAMDAPKAAALFGKACVLRDAEGCLNLGRVYQAGSGVQRDTGRAAEYYRRALSIEPGMAAATRALASLVAD